MLFGNFCGLAGRLESAYSFALHTSRGSNIAVETTDAIAPLQARMKSSITGDIGGDIRDLWLPYLFEDHIRTRRRAGCEAAV